MEDDESGLDYEANAFKEIETAVGEIRLMLKMIEEKSKQDSKVISSLLEDISNTINSLWDQIDEIEHELDKCKIFPD